MFLSNVRSVEGKYPSTKARNNFKKDIKSLYKKYDIPEKKFIVLCTSCGSPKVKMYVWNPTAFTEECTECGYSEMFTMRPAINV